MFKKVVVSCTLLLLVLACGNALAVEKHDVAKRSPQIEAPIKQAQPPNIVLLYMDDLGWKDLSYAGSQYYETPNIDALAASGMQFSRAYSPAAVCAPSRGGVVTGRTPARNKYTNVFYGGDQVVNEAKDDSLHDQSKEYGVGNTTLEAKHRHALGKENVLFAQKLSEAGYATAYLGKWHNGLFDGFRPQDRGYTYVSGTTKKKDGGFYDHYLTKQSLELLYNMPEAKEGDYLAELLTNKAVKFIERNQDKPFLLHLSHYLVHGPIIPKKELVAKYQAKTGDDQRNFKYATMVEAMDDSVGRVMATLKALNLLDNTLVLFTSDNGGLSLSGITSNYPLRGGKSFSLEGGIRVPFIASWPGKIAAGTINNTRITGLDLYPTILDTAGLPQAPEQHMDGMNLLPLLTGKELAGNKTLNGDTLAKRALYFHFPHYTHATSPHSTIIVDGHKLIRYYNDEAGRFALYDLDNDQAEQYDLSAQMPALVNKMDQQLSDYLTSVGAELPIDASSDLGKQQIEKFYQGQLSGFSLKSLNSWQVRNKKTEYDYANMERRCFEKYRANENCKMSHYKQFFTMADIDRDRLASLLKQ